MRGADNLTTLQWPLSGNLEASASWNAQGLSSSVEGLLYVYVFIWKFLPLPSHFSHQRYKSYSKVVPIRGMKAYRGRMSINPSILKLGAR